MQSVGWLTTTTLNVNTNVKLSCSFATKFFAVASFKTMQDLIFLSRTSNFIDDEELFFVFVTSSSGKTPAFRMKIIELST